MDEKFISDLKQSPAIPMGDAAYWRAKCEELVAENERLNTENENISEKFHQITNWCKAYPLQVFPEPDMKKAHELLKVGGITIDSVSAYAMRHVLVGIQKIIDGE